MGGEASRFGRQDFEHALVGAAIEHAESGGVVLTGRLSRGAQPWLVDHMVGDAVVFPGTGFVELAIRAGDAVGCSVVEELIVQAPLVLPDRGGVAIQVVVGAQDSGSRPVSVYSRAAQPDSGWALHAQGAVTSAEVTSGDVEDLAAWPPPGADAVDIAEAYQQLAQRGYGYGPAFRGLTAMWRRGQQVFAEIALPEEVAAQVDGYGIHPALLDAALHAALLGFAEPVLMLPFVWERVCLHAAGAVSARVAIRATDEQSVTVTLADSAGLPAVTVGELTLHPIADEQLRALTSPVAAPAPHHIRR